MADDGKQLIQIPAEKLIDALLHAKQFEQHYATQDSVDSLKDRMTEKFAQVHTRFAQVEKQMDIRFEQVDIRFEQVDSRFTQMEKKMDTRFEQVEKQIGEFKTSTDQKLLEHKTEINRRFDKLETKSDRLQWFIVAAALALIFKDNLLKMMAGMPL